MNHENDRQDPDDQDALAALLRATGPRPMPSATAMAEAREAVAAEWREVSAARDRARKPVLRHSHWAAAAAGIAIAAVAVWMIRSNVDAPAATVASLSRIEGTVEQDHGNGQWTRLVAGEGIRVGTRLRTSAEGRAALALSSGVELRLDHATLIALEDPGHAGLVEGAVYVDSGATPGPAARDLALDTPVGRVRHLGTQYFARSNGTTLQVGVREGRIALEGPAGTAIGAPGEQITITDGRLSRAPLAGTAAEWQWIADVTPPFSLDGRTVEEFLVWAARETGRSIVYATPEAGRQARSITLSGSVEGLAPDAALQAVLSTTSLRPEIGTERIRIETTTD
jgi:ferric-dicitrate binding protein FerR (iron transport regulator)